jgi:hypothetical protein
MRLTGYSENNSATMKTAAEFSIYISPPKGRIFALLLVAADLIIIFAIMRDFAHRRTASGALYYLKLIILIHFAP